MTGRYAHAIIAGVAAALLLPALPAGAQFNPFHECGTCHSMHSPAPGSNFLLNNAVVETLCLTCHGAGGISTMKAEVHTNKVGSAYPAFTMTCMDCHNPHSNQPNAEGGVNLKMIGDDELDASGFSKILTPNSGLREVVFESRGPDFSMPTLHSFADTDEDGDLDLDGVCEVCHTSTPNHSNSNLGPHHNTGASCVGCHAHDNFFWGDGDCLSCHVDSQGPRRAIVPEFSRTSHHVSTGVTVEDCEVCHDQSEHREGEVRLWNVDFPGDLGAVINLNADPFFDQSRARDLEEFCLACHDADGANGSAPFSDAQMPPIIDTTLWNNGSHANDNITCFGDGQFGCHNTGHGSNKTTLLSPGNYTNDADPDDPFAEEERFCFQCHNASGPSAFDLETPFSEPINWVPEPAGLNDNEDLNDRHDVQFTAQNRSGAIIECADCHDPHSASSARPWRQDPDPGDGHVPGTDWYFAGYQSAGDEHSEFCLDCHDGSFPAAVRGHTDAPAGVDSPNVPLVNIRTTWVNDGMGARVSSNLDIDTTTGWGSNFLLACGDCHRPHPVFDADVGSTTLFMLNDLTRATDGTPLQGMMDRNGTLTTNFEYGVITTVSSDPRQDPGTWCMTCHNRSGMVTKGNDCTNCHRHGDGSRF